MWCVGILQIGANALELAGKTSYRKLATHQLKAEKDEIGVQNIRFTIAANSREIASLPGIPNLGAIEPELAGKTQQNRGVRESGPCAVLKAGQHVHQIDVPPMEATQVVVEAKAGILGAHFPVARRGHRPAVWRIGQ